MSRFSLNQATVMRADLGTAVEAVVAAGIPAIGLWREPVAEAGLRAAVRLVRAAGLSVSSLCRAGFLTGDQGPARRTAIDDNHRAIAEAHELGAAALVLVAGGLPPGSRDLVGARSRAMDAIAELAPVASDAGVRLAVEALHPMYASDRSVVSTLKQALDIAEPFPAEVVGVVVDTFHLWWDPDLAVEIARAGRSQRIASFQICDWVTPIAEDPLLSRGIPGDGDIDFASFSAAVSAAGYGGDIECEVFRQSVWDDDPFAVARRSLDAFRRLVEPAFTRQVVSNRP